MTIFDELRFLKKYMQMYFFEIDFKLSPLNGQTLKQEQKEVLFVIVWDWSVKPTLSSFFM